MHCVELAELASILSLRAPAFIAAHSVPSSDCLTHYWVQSRRRLDLWNQGLGQYTALESSGRPLAMQLWWHAHGPLLEEIIVSDTLTRVFAAFGAALDGSISQREVEPVTHSVFLSQLEARNRVLQLMLFGRGGSVTQSMHLNRLRRVTERWTDRLLAPIVAIQGRAACYAIDANRLAASIQECEEDSGDETRIMGDWLSQAALTSALSSRTSELAASPEANRDVAESIVACFRPDWFDSLGLPRSARSIRNTSSHTDRQLDPSTESLASVLFPRSKHLSIMPSENRSGFSPHSARWLL